jgi:hypothetical protein
MGEKQYYECKMMGDGADIKGRAINSPKKSEINKRGAGAGMVSSRGSGVSKRKKVS